MSYVVGGLKVQVVLETLVYHHARGHIRRDVKAGNILVDSNGANKLTEVGVFVHPCLILGIGNTQEILLLVFLTGATLEKVVVHDISIFSSQKFTCPSYMQVGNRINRRIIRTLEFYHVAGRDNVPTAFYPLWKLLLRNKKAIKVGRSEVQMRYRWKSWN